MSDNFLKPQIYYSPDEAGAGASEGDAAAVSDDASSQKAIQSETASNGSDASAVVPSSSEQSDALELYRPEGLADNLYGKSDHETMDNMAKALKGYRDKASRHYVPDDPSEYKEFDDVSDAIAPYVKDLADDGFMDLMASRVQKEGVSKNDFASTAKAFLEAGLEAGILEPPLDVEAEREALIPDQARHLPKTEQDAEIDKRIQGNHAWLQMMEKRGLDKGAIDYAITMLGDRAKGHEFIEFMRGQMEAKGSQPMTNGSTAQQYSLDDLRKMEMDPRNIHGNPEFDRDFAKTVSQAWRDYKKSGSST